MKKTPFHWGERTRGATQIRTDVPLFAVIGLRRPLPMPISTGPLLACTYRELA